jgi:uncharacterized protein
MCPVEEIVEHGLSQRFDASRVRALPRGESLLVMDRVSGAWLTLQGEAAFLFPLLGTEPADLPLSVRPKLENLTGLLLEHRVGVPKSERRFGDLNTIILKLTNACNHACRYCYDFEKFESSTRLNIDLAHRAIEQALELAAPNLCVILHGGEPMLLWDLIEDVVQFGEDLARQKGKRIGFVGQSNFSRVNDRIVEFSEGHQIAWGVSVDGTPEVHDRNRVDHRGRGTYEQFQAALERYPEFVRRCGVMSTITATNQDKLLQAACHFRDLGMAAWDWSLFQPIGRGRAGAGFGLDTEVLLSAWDELFAAVESGEFDGFPVAPVRKYLLNFIRGPGDNMCMRGECGAARDLLSVSATGALEACDCIDPTGPLAGLGNLARTTLAEARASPVAEKIRGRDLKAASCVDCIWFAVCGGTCLAHAPSLNEVWADGCALAMRAFDRISDSVTRHDRLITYLQSTAWA